MIKRKLVITAPTSAVCRNFIKYVEHEYDIVTLGRRESDIYYDFRSNESITLPDDVHAIVHFAGVLKEDTDSSALEMVDVNTKGILAICKAAKSSGVKEVVNISSINATLPYDSPYYGFYAMTKRHGEEAAYLYCKKMGIGLCNIRPSQIFGIDRAYAKTQRLLYSMFENASLQKDICIYGTKDALRNYIYDENLFNLIHKAVEGNVTETIDAIDRKNYKIGEVAKMIIELSRSKSEIRFLKDKPDLDDNAFEMGTDWYSRLDVPFIEFKEGVNKVINSLYS